MVVGQCRITQEGGLGTTLAGEGGNLGVIGGNNNALETAGGLGCLDGITDHWLSAKRADILARNALAAPPGRDDGDGHEVSP